MAHFSEEIMLSYYFP